MRRGEHEESGAWRAGAWIVGARGSVATTARVGAAAIADGLMPPQGLVTALPGLDRPELPAVADLVFGGHDTATTPLAKRAEELAAGGVLPAALLPAVADTLARTERELRPGLGPASGAGIDPGGGTGAGGGSASGGGAGGGPASGAGVASGAAGGPRSAAGAGTARRVVDRAAGEIAAFRARHGLETVVVVNLASTDAASADCPPDLTAAALDARLDDSEAAPPVGLLAACAAIGAGCPFVDFTPSVATQTPALAALACERGLPYAGRDGKTGETLVKTALAPLFAYRHLAVRSWSGTNLLGGSDGAALADPDRAASKLASKQRGLAAILGSEPAGPLHIDYVPDLGEWKTAWDHVTFEGFLGTRMSLQFTWQGCDSALAAPLVLDLVRLVAAAHRAGRAGPQGALGFFFKDPVGSVEHALERQFQRLCAWLEALPSPTPGGVLP